MAQDATKTSKPQNDMDQTSDLLRRLWHYPYIKCTRMSVVTRPHEETLVTYPSKRNQYLLIRVGNKAPIVSFLGTSYQ